MRRACHVGLLDKNGYLMGEGDSILPQEPTSWVYQQMELEPKITVAIITDVVIKDDDFIVARLDKRAILREDFEEAKERGEIRFTYNQPGTEAPTDVTDAVKKFDEFISLLTDTERRILLDKLIGGA